MKNEIKFKIESFLHNDDFSKLSQEELIEQVIAFIRSKLYKFNIRNNEDFEQDCIYKILCNFDKIQKSQFKKAYINRLVESSIIDSLNKCKIYKNNFELNGKEAYEQEYDILDLSCLDEREVKIFKALKEGYTEKEIGKVLKISRQRINQIKKEIFEKLKEQI